MPSLWEDRPSPLGSCLDFALPPVSFLPPLTISNSLATLVGMENVSKHLKVDRNEGVVTWKGKILGLLEELAPGETRQTVTLFVEPEDYVRNGFLPTEHPHPETVSEIEDHLVLGYCVHVQREPWPGRRGM